MSQYIIDMSYSYSDISNFVSEAKKKKTLTTGDCDAPAVDDSDVKITEEKKKGLWDNIHAKRKRGEKPAKPGDEDYPKTLDIDEAAPMVAAIGRQLLAKAAVDKIKKMKEKKEKEEEKEEEEVSESAAWTRKEGKNKAGGLNEKGRKSYEAENPGSDLKAPSKEKGNNRRASFCARMKGMKKKLTSAKTASDPDSRINKSLRAWDC